MKSRALIVCAFVAELLFGVSPHAGETDGIESLVRRAREGAIFERFTAIRALGRSADPRAFAPLADIVENAEREDVQNEAVRALGDLKDARAIPVLIETLAFVDRRTDGTSSKGSVAAEVLRDLGKDAVPPLCEALSHPNKIVRKEAGRILGWLGDLRSLAPLIEAMADSTWHDDRYVYIRLKPFGQPAMDALVQALDDDRPWVRIGAARSLANAGYRKAADALAKRLSDYNDRVRYEVALALAALDDRRGVDVLVAALPDVAAKKDYGEIGRLSKALANLGGRRVVEALIKGLSVEEDRVRRQFEWVLGEIGDTLAVIPLIEVINERGGHRGAAYALGKIGDPRAVDPLVYALENAKFPDSRAIVWALGELRSPRAVNALIKFATSRGWRMSDGGPDPVGALVKIGEPAVDAIKTAIECDSLPAGELRRALAQIRGIKALDFLLQRPGPIDPYGWLDVMGRDAVPRLLEGLKNADPVGRRHCVSALGENMDPRSVEPLCEMLKDRDADVRRETVYALSRLNDTRAVEPLIEALADDDAEVQSAVIIALLRLRDPTARPALDRLAADKNAPARIRYLAWRYSKALQVPRFPFNRSTGWKIDRPPDVRARWRAPTGEIFFVGDLGAVWICIGDSCGQMESSTTEDLYSVWGTSGRDVFAAGKRGTIIHYDGRTWSMMASGSKNGLYRIIGTAPDDVFTIGWAGTILHYDGVRWEAMESPTQLTLRDVWAYASNDIYVVGDGGVALHYDGTSWNIIDTPTSGDLFTIWGDSTHNVYAGGGNKIILRNWERIKNKELNYVDRIWGLSTGETYFEGGPGAHVCRLVGDDLVSFDNLWTKRNWNESVEARVLLDMESRALTVYGDKYKLLRDVWPERWGEHAWRNASSFWSPVNDCLFTVDPDGRVWYYDGTEWYSVKLNKTSKLIDIAGVSPSNFYVLGGWKDEVIHFSGSTIQNVGPGTEKQLDAIWVGSDNNVFVAGKRGLIMRYDGNCWKTMKSRTQYDMRSIWGTSPRNVYAVGRWGTIIHYDGHTWRRQRTTTRLDLNAVWGINKQTVFAVGEAGRVLRYNGRKWSRMNSGVTSNLFDVWGTGPDNVFACGDYGVIVHFDGKRWTQMYTGTTAPFDALGGASSSRIFAATREGLYRYYDHSPSTGSSSERDNRKSPPDVK